MMAADQNTLDLAFRDAILERLGFSAAPLADLDGLQAVYRAWCEHVPFENVGKVIALRRYAAPRTIRTRLFSVLARAWFRRNLLVHRECSP